MQRTGLVAALTLIAAPAAATTLSVTVTNEFGSDGFALTPVYSAFHNGSFDTYNIGDPATQGLETLAELGAAGDIMSERTASNPESTAGLVFGGPEGMPRPIFGGETATAEIEITDETAQRFFSFLSMVVPTNDTFIGNGDPTEFEIFDAAGTFLGPQTITVTGDRVRDAGTEVNDPADGPAFAAGIDATAGTVEGGTVQPGFADLALFEGLETAGGFTIGTDLFGDGATASDFTIATITISEVAPVPLPAGGVLLLSALGLGVAVRRKRNI